MKKKHINCKDIFNRICDTLDQTLDSPTCRDLKHHLDDCPDCLAYLDSMKKTIVLYRKYPNPKIPGKVHKQLLKKLKL